LRFIFTVYLPKTAFYFSQKNTKNREKGKVNINKAGRESIIRKSESNNNNNTPDNGKNKRFFVDDKWL
jgi:hypothetical protein